MYRLPQITDKPHNASPWRTVAAVLIGLATLTVWVMNGDEVLTALNPQLGHELALVEHPPLDVWISPPSSTASVTPTIISTPAGVRFTHNTITIPQGSIISAHLADQDGAPPELFIDDTKGTEFTADQHGDYEATVTLSSGKKLSIRRGWLTLASWKINVVADNPPTVTMTEPPTLALGKSLRLAYSASDAFEVSAITLRVTPNNPLPGANNKPVDIRLPTEQAAHVAHIVYADLNAYPWAGQNVTLQIIATNEAGKTSQSASVNFTLPERSFTHPLSRILIEERNKLLQHPDDGKLRDETAGIIAGIAHETSNYHSDPVVLMSLRTGAVRLVLNNDSSTVSAVSDLLWKTASRIEDGFTSTTQGMLSDGSHNDSANMSNQPHDKTRANP